MQCLCCHRNYSRIDAGEGGCDGKPIEDDGINQTSPLGSIIILFLFIIFIIAVPTLIWFSGMLDPGSSDIEEIGEMMVTFGPVSGCKRGEAPKNNDQCHQAFEMEKFSDSELYYWGQTTGGVSLESSPYGCVFSERSHVIFFNTVQSDGPLPDEHKFNRVCIITDQSEIELETLDSIEVVDPNEPIRQKGKDESDLQLIAVETKKDRAGIQVTTFTSSPRDEMLPSREDPHCSRSHTTLEESSEVILLVSYKGSGATVLRHYIQKMSGIVTASAHEWEESDDVMQPCLKANAPANGESIVVNSHAPSFTNDKLSKKANINGMILLQRNPFSTFQEFFSWQKKNDTSPPGKLRKAWNLAVREQMAAQYVEFYNHYRSRPTFGPVLHLFYEDLISNPLVEMERVEGFLMSRKSNFKSRPKWRDCFLDEREGDCSIAPADTRWVYGLALKDFVCDIMDDNESWFYDVWGECHLQNNFS